MQSYKNATVAFLIANGVQFMKHQDEKQVGQRMAGLDRERLATYIRNKMADEKLSLRKAAELAGCSPATFSRILGDETDGYMPDTTTLNAIAKWLNKDLSAFAPTNLVAPKSLADVAVHLHALPDLAPADAQFIMNVVQLLYDDKRKPPPEKE
jgi:transcriptional regulator with XRE-family HTH domain